MNDLGKPDAREPHVRFDEEALETGGYPWWGELCTAAKATEDARPPTGTRTAPVPYSPERAEDWRTTDGSGGAGGSFRKSVARGAGARVARGQWPLVAGNPLALTTHAGGCTSEVWGTPLERAHDVQEGSVRTGDGVPIEELPGWDAERQVFVLDRSRSAAAKRRARPVGERAREQVESGSARRKL
jgi:hypothetical protein